MALQTPKFYFAGSKRARKSRFLWSIDRKNPQFEQALRATLIKLTPDLRSAIRVVRPIVRLCAANSAYFITQKWVRSTDFGL
ncbi:MAG: hypothetical protein LBD18_03485 [Treponema sp.]|nr:hypothetical protein [Treponema sp.]